MTAYVRKTRCATVRDETTGRVVAVVFDSDRRTLEQKRQRAREAFAESLKSNSAQWARML